MDYKVNYEMLKVQDTNDHESYVTEYLFGYIEIPDRILNNTKISPIQKLVIGLMRSELKSLSTQEEAAKELGITEKELTKALKGLVRMGILAKI
jgi:hypothetical protein